MADAGRFTHLAGRRHSSGRDLPSARSVMLRQCECVAARESDRWRQLRSRAELGYPVVGALVTGTIDLIVCLVSGG
jgi:hypothetical protein